MISYEFIKALYIYIGVNRIYFIDYTGTYTLNDGLLTIANH